MDLTAFVTGLPKVELHLHLVGSATPAAVVELAARSPESGVPADVDELRRLYEFRDFLHFLDVYKLVTRLVRRAEDFVTLTVSLAADLAAQNVRYAEVTVTPLLHARYGVSAEVIAEGLNEGARRALAESGVELAWCYDIPARDDTEGGLRTLRLALDSPADALVSLGLGGAEIGYPRSAYRDAFAGATAAGLRSVPHAGEASDSDSVWQSVRDLRADRVGHGIRAVDDPRLMEYLAANDIALEVCPTSNVRTKVVPAMPQHPLRRLMDAGVRVTLNSDDPPMFGTNLVNEYLVAGTVLGLSQPGLAALAHNAVHASFLSSEAKRRMHTDIAAFVATATSADEVLA
jgi:aminodeoxyfutalosine deaminase